ncbi:surface-adhesin E family protein [Thermodesulfobium sp. 4217-1]|uniref:surface-adhesin E family protein n=1 Tax=Thermodesulfobium sp. 4217-1 TaxID=3120013 RepID=UPI003221CE9A
MEDRWFLAVVTEDEDYFIDMHSIQEENNFLEVIIKETLKSESAKKRENDFIKSKINEEINLDHSLWKWRFNPKNMTYTILTIGYFDSEGRLLLNMKSDENDLHWEEIEPDTTAESIFEAVKDVMQNKPAKSEDFDL